MTAVKDEEEDLVGVANSVSAANAEDRSASVGEAVTLTHVRSEHERT